jgi:hypothetical protein
MSADLVFVLPRAKSNGAATALTGTASFFVLLAQGTEIAKYLTGIVAAASSLDSVFRFSRKARAHEALCRRFTDLSSKIAGWEPTPANLKKARADRLKIERDEPPVRRLVDLQAQNEEARSRGVSDDQLVPLGPFQRSFLGYAFAFGMRRLEKWHAEHSKRAEVGPIQPTEQAAIPGPESS